MYFEYIMQNGKESVFRLLCEDFFKQAPLNMFCNFRVLLRKSVLLFRASMKLDFSYSALSKHIPVQN